MTPTPLPSVHKQPVSSSQLNAETPAHAVCCSKLWWLGKAWVQWPRQTWIICPGPWGGRDAGLKADKAAPWVGALLVSFVIILTAAAWYGGSIRSIIQLKVGGVTPLILKKKQKDFFLFFSWRRLLLIFARQQRPTLGCVSTHIHPIKNRGISRHFQLSAAPTRHSVPMHCSHLR